MTATATTIEQPAGGGLTWYALSAQDVTSQLGVGSSDANLTRCLRTSRRVRPVNTAVRDTLVGLPRFPNRSVATST